MERLPEETIAQREALIDAHLLRDWRAEVAELYGSDYYMSHLEASHRERTEGLGRLYGALAGTVQGHRLSGYEPLEIRKAREREVCAAIAREELVSLISMFDGSEPVVWSRAAPRLMKGRQPSSYQMTDRSDRPRLQRVLTLSGPARLALLESAQNATAIHLEAADAWLAFMSVVKIEEYLERKTVTAFQIEMSAALSGWKSQLQHSVGESLGLAPQPQMYGDLARLSRQIVHFVDCLPPDTEFNAYTRLSLVREVYKDIKVTQNFLSKETLPHIQVARHHTLVPVIKVDAARWASEVIERYDDVRELRNSWGLVGRERLRRVRSKEPVRLVNERFRQDPELRQELEAAGLDPSWQLPQMIHFINMIRALANEIKPQQSAVRPIQDKLMDDAHIDAVYYRLVERAGGPSTGLEEAQIYVQNYSLQEIIELVRRHWSLLERAYLTVPRQKPRMQHDLQIVREVLFPAPVDEVKLEKTVSRRKEIYRYQALLDQVQYLLELANVSVEFLLPDPRKLGRAGTSIPATDTITGEPVGAHLANLIKFASRIEPEKIRLIHAIRDAFGAELYPQRLKGRTERVPRFALPFMLEGGHKITVVEGVQDNATYLHYASFGQRGWQAAFGERTYSAARDQPDVRCFNHRRGKLPAHVRKFSEKLGELGLPAALGEEVSARILERLAQDLDGFGTH